MTGKSGNVPAVWSRVFETLGPELTVTLKSTSKET